ncbi:hypothetical protein DXG01_004194, partial [Tephrocybe rancida]
MLRDDFEPHLLECSIESWFETYIAPAEQDPYSHFLNLDLVKDVQANISKDILGSDGWKPIIDAVNHDADASADDIYGNLRGIATAVADAAYRTDPSFQTGNFLLCTGPQTAATEGQDFLFNPTLRALPEVPHVSAFTLGENDILDDTQVERPLCISPRGATANALHRTTVQELLKDTSAVAAIGAFKKESKYDRLDDNGLRLCGAADIIFDDPRRRFLFAFNIEDDMMRLWNINRGHEPYHLIHFLLFLLCATAVQLGFDPTIRRRLVNSPEGVKTVAYEYIVRNTAYLTEGSPISDAAADYVHSRATRVWLVREILSREGSLKLSATFYVLKDVWLASGARLEREIRDEIFKNLEELDQSDGTQHAVDAQSYFMTFRDDWRIQSRGIPDTSFEPPPGSTEASFTSLQQEPYTPPVGSSSTSDFQMYTASLPSLLQYCPRSHVRTVIDEVCHSIYELRDYATVARTLLDNIKGLVYLRKAGFVHRDMSAGNCLWHSDSCKGKLSDLEYACAYSPLSDHEPLMGTPSFMAVEYQEQSYLFLPQPTLETVEKLFETDSEDLACLPGTWSPPYRYNFYHDLESVFWIYAWFLHHFLPTKFHNSEKNLALISDSVRQRLDCGLRGSRSRTRIICDQSKLLDMAHMLMDHYYSSMKQLVWPLGILLDVTEGYRAVEATDPGVAEDKPCAWDTGTFTEEPYHKTQARFQELLTYIEAHGEGGCIPA